MSTINSSERAVAVLARIATEFSALTVTLPEFLTRGLAVLGQDLAFDHCAVALFDERGGGRLVVRATTGRAAPLLGKTLPRGLHDGVIRTGQPALSADLRAGGYFPDSEFRSGICVPLTVHERSIGVVYAFRLAADAVTDQDVHLLVVVARYFSSAIQLARLHEQPVTSPDADTLTELPTEATFRDILEREVRRGQRYGQPVALVCVDVDGLATVRRAQGEAPSHTILRTLARSLRAMFRESDIVARATHGFLLLLPHTPKRAAVSVAERVRQRARTIPLDPGPAITVSVGVAEAPQDGTTGDALLTAAQRALEAAQRRGGDCVEAAASRDSDA
jgi:diguanylate cyclase (GGDEF)-like protein